MNIFRFGPLPMLMYPDESGAGAGGGSGGGDGGQGAGSGDQGNQGQGQGNQGDGGDSGGKGNQSGDGQGDGKGAGAGAGDQGKGAEGGDGDGQAKVKPFPDDWREQMATGQDGKVDEKQLKILKRFNSPKDYNNAYFALNQKISSGEFKKPLSKDAKPEEVAEWRKENGIPEKPEEYLKGLPEGVVFGDADKAVLDPFLKDMHDKNVSPAAVHSALNAYHQSQKYHTEQVQIRDQEIAQQTEDELRVEWGPDYRPNINAVNAFIDANFPVDIKESLMNARLGDQGGTPLMHSPHVLRAFASLGRILNPQSTVTHGKSMDSMSAMEDQIAAYEKRMGSKEWFKDEKAQAHYRELITARDRMKGNEKKADAMG